MADNDVPLSPVKGVSKMDSHRSSMYTRRFVSLGKTIPERANGDAIVGRRIHQPAAGATFFRLPDVRVGNVFSVCSASYRPASGSFIFTRHARFNGEFITAAQNAPRDTLLLI